MNTKTKNSSAAVSTWHRAEVSRETEVQQREMQTTIAIEFSGEGTSLLRTRTTVIGARHQVP